MDEATEYVEFQKALSQQYLIEGRLGKGACGKVYKAKCKQEGKPYAIKMIPANQDGGKYQKRELDALIKLNRLQESRRHFIKYYEAWILKLGEIEKLCIKMELCSGDLRTFIYKNRHFDPQITQAVQGPRFYQHVFQQILNGLDVIHSIGWVHRDIHPGNILVVNSSPQRVSDIHIKIGDFGLAKNIGIEFKVSPGLSVHSQPEKSTPGRAGIYTAPELLTETYDEKVDLYSAGIVLYFISRYPKNEEEWNKELQDLMQSKFRIHERVFYKDDKKLVTLITDLLEENPDKRPTACEAKEYMLPETKDTTDGSNASKTAFYARIENEEELRTATRTNSGR